MDTGGPFYVFSSICVGRLLLRISPKPMVKPYSFFVYLIISGTLPCLNCIFYN